MGKMGSLPIKLNFPCSSSAFLFLLSLVENFPFPKTLFFIPSPASFFFFLSFLNPHTLTLSQSGMFG